MSFFERSGCLIIASILLGVIGFMSAGASISVAFSSKNKTSALSAKLAHADDSEAEEDQSDSGSAAGDTERNVDSGDNVCNGLPSLDGALSVVITSGRRYFSNQDFLIPPTPFVSLLLEPPSRSC